MLLVNILFPENENLETLLLVGSWVRPGSLAGFCSDSCPSVTGREDTWLQDTCVSRLWPAPDVWQVLGISRVECVGDSAVRLSVLSVFSRTLLPFLRRLLEIAEARFPLYFNTEEKLLQMSSKVHLHRELTCEGVLQR